MKKRKILTRICTLALAASLVFTTSSTAFAAAPPEEPTAEDGFSNGETPDNPTGTTEENEPTQETEKPGKNNAAPEAEQPKESNTAPEAEQPKESNTAPDAEQPKESDAKPEVPGNAQEDSAIPADTEGNPETPANTETTPTISEETNEKSETSEESQGRRRNSVRADANPATTPGSATDGEQGTTNGIQIKDDNLVYLDGALYNGYYMDSAGILYLVTNGVAEPASGIVNGGTPYYKLPGSESLTLQAQTVFVNGKIYSGYFMDSNGIMYSASNGTPALVTGMVNGGTPYYKFPSNERLTLQAQTVFVNGKIYSGYFMDTAGILYRVSNGAPALVTGSLKANTSYYSLSAKGNAVISQQTLYVEGKVYSGYYLNSKNKMYRVKKGSPALLTGTLKAKAKYYDYNKAKEQTLSRQTLYVKGKSYSGYYLNSKNKMYRAKNGSLTLLTGTLKAKTKYYDYKKAKVQRLSKQKLYVKGKLYSGYYMNGKNNMYRAKKGSLTLFTGTLKAKTKYYSYKKAKTLKLAKQKLYVKGKLYTGYYMDSRSTMYRAKKGSLTPISGMLGAGTKYYGRKAGKTQTLPADTLYVDGKVYTGYYMGSDNRMYHAERGICTPVSAALGAGTPYYNQNAKGMQTLPAQTVFVNGKAMEGMSPESLATLQRAQAVVASITNDSMSMETKLQVCFDYVKTYQESRPRMPHYTGMDWPVIYANDMFVNGSGNCCSYAAAFAYMAKAIGYEEVYCCNSGGHGWAGINGLVYDPEWSKWHHAYSYYALSYDTPTDQDYKGAIGAGKPWMRIKL